MKSSIKYIEFDNYDKTLEFLNSVSVKDILIDKLRNGAENSTYYGLIFKKNEEHNKISFKIIKENFKITPQKQTKNGLTKVKCTFFIDGKLGEIFNKIDQIVVESLRLKFSQKTHPKIISLVQTETINIETDEVKKLDKSLGWITMQHKCDNGIEKDKYGGRIINITKTDKFSYTNPTFIEINKFWKQRAYVTGYINLDNILIMRTKEIFFSCSFNTFKPLYITPINKIDVDNEDDIRELQMLAEDTIEPQNKIYSIDDIKDDFDENQIN